MIDLNNLKVNCILDVEHVLDFELIIKQNEHACMRIAVRIKADRAGDINSVLKKVNDSEISVETKIPEKGSAKVVFAGVVRKCNFIHNAGTYICYFQALSKTCLLDRDRKDKIFQNKGSSRQDMIKDFVEKNGARIKFHTDDVKQDSIFFQYQETDWEFIRRVAGHDHQPIVVDYKSGNIGMHYGIEFDLDEVNFREHGYESGFVAKSRDHELLLDGVGRNEIDIYYIVRDYADYEIGRKVCFLGKALYIAEKLAETEGGCIVFSYRLCAKEAMMVKKKFNDRLIGCIITGEVVDVKEENLYIKFDLEEMQVAYPFPWMPVTGNVFYCMPEIGSKVQVCFCDEDENKMNFACHIVDDAKLGKLPAKIKGLIRKNKGSMVISSRNIHFGESSSIRLSQGMLQIASDQQIKLQAVGNMEIEAGLISFDTQDELVISHQRG